MVISLVVAIYFTWVHDALAAEPVALVPAMADWAKLVAGSLITTAGWVCAAFVLPPESPAVLQRFVNLVRPGGPGWSRFKPEGGAQEPSWNVPRALLQAALGCLAVYGALLGVGGVLFDGGMSVLVFGLVTGLSIWGILRLQHPAA